MTAASTPPPGPAPTAPGPPPVGDGFSWRRFWLLGAMVLVFGAGATILLWVVGSSLGLRATIVGVGAAILPAPILVAVFLWLGRHQATPAKYLAFAFAWGACVSTSISLGVNTLASNWFADHYDDSALVNMLTATVVAPVIEELTKAIGPLLIFLFRRRYFTGIIDGIVYCGLSAVGFAMMENILYLGNIFAKGDDSFGVAGGAFLAAILFVFRIVLTGFAHPLFTSMFGIGLGIARRTRHRWTAIVLPISMLLMSMALHSAWNLFASLGLTALLAGYTSIMIPIFTATVATALWMRASEARLATRTLPDYAMTGWISPPEIASLATYRRRSSARLWAKRVAGPDGLRAMREYQHAATRLALLRDRVQRGITEADDATNERHLLETLTRCRSVFARQDPAMPRAMWDGRFYQIEFPDGSVRQVNSPPQPVMPIPVAVSPYQAAPQPHPTMPWLRR